MRIHDVAVSNESEIMDKGNSDKSEIMDMKNMDNGSDNSASAPDTTEIGDMVLTLKLCTVLIGICPFLFS